MSVWFQTFVFPDSLNSGGTFYSFGVLLSDHTDPNSLSWAALCNTSPSNFTHACLQMMAVLQKGIICGGLLGRAVTRSAEWTYFTIPANMHVVERREQKSDSNRKQELILVSASHHYISSAAPETRLSKTRRTCRSLLPPSPVLIWFKVSQ